MPLFTKLTKRINRISNAKVGTLLGSEAAMRFIQFYAGPGRSEYLKCELEATTAVGIKFEKNKKILN